MDAAGQVTVQTIPAPPAIAGGQGSRIGLNTHFYMNPNPALISQEMQTLRQSGISLIRDNFKWDQVQPTAQRWKWEVPDAIMRGAATTGLDVLAVLGYSAPWASSDPSPNHATMWPPTSTSDYAAFVQAVADRYTANGQFWRENPELPVRPLFAIEIWNEPQSLTYWNSGPDPALYAQVARTAAKPVKLRHPEIKVLVSGELLISRSDTTSSPWLESLLAVSPDIATWCDALSVHPYPNPLDLSPFNVTGDLRYRFDRIQLIRSVESAHNIALPLWVTEIGWPTAGAKQVSEATQASYLQGAVHRSFASYGSYVQMAFAFSWDKTVDDGDSRFGLRRADGSAKPAWSALLAEAKLWPR